MRQVRGPRREQVSTEEAQISQYIMIYKGAATDMSEMTPEQGAEVMAKWGAGMGKVGSALADIGAPFGDGISVVDNGTAGAAAAPTGHSMVEADSLAAAQGLADGHPFLSERSGNYAIEVFELRPVPFES